uniref:Uncharacterized protein n=1 Tax=Romanomermis culicivorax TaxID=13658 RepID=A0A915L248_ROMCU
MTQQSAECVESGERSWYSNCLSLRSINFQAVYKPGVFRDYKSPCLGVRIEHGEIADDDRNGQGDGQHAGQGA